MLCKAPRHPREAGDAETCCFFCARLYTVRVLRAEAALSDPSLMLPLASRARTDPRLRRHFQRRTSNLRAQLHLQQSWSPQDTVVLAHLLQDKKSHWHTGGTCCPCHAHSQADRCTTQDYVLERAIPPARTGIPAH